MKSEVTKLFIRTQVHHIATELGNRYLVIDDELFMAVPVLENGKNELKML